MQNYFSWTIVTLMLFLTGCSTPPPRPNIPLADTAHDQQAKNFKPKTKLSNIYFHQSDYLEKFFVSSVCLDGRDVGKISSGDFMQLEVPPGQHVVDVFTENIVHPESNSCTENVELTMEEGGNYFLTSANLFNGNCIRKIDEATGKLEVSKRRLILIPKGVRNAIASSADKTSKGFCTQPISSSSVMFVAPHPPSFASPEKLVAPRPIQGNVGKFMSPFTAAGQIAPWAQPSSGGKDNGSDMAANIGGAAGQQLANKALDFIPFGLGGMVGKVAGESAGRSVTSKNIEPELPSMEVVKGSSDISFNSANELAVYLYAKHSSHGQYSKVLALAEKVYPELEQVYVASIEKASKNRKKKT